MSNGIKLKSPSYTKDTNLYKLEHIPGVLLPVGAHHAVTVSAGDHVYAGQLVGVSLSQQTPLHSSISGTVRDIISIGEKEYIKIESDGKFELYPDISPCSKRLSEMTDEEMTERIRLCGIKEWKYISSLIGKAKRLAVNCLDSDPWSAERKCIVNNYPKELVGGAKILLRILGLRMCEFVIEKKYTNSVNRLVESIAGSSLFDIIETDGIYPLGENMRIVSQLPATRRLGDDELCVLDVSVVRAIYRAFSKGMPYVNRIVSVGGDLADEPGCYEIPIGLPVKYIAMQTLPKKQKKLPAYKTIENGVMSGHILDHPSAVVSPSTHSLIFTKEKELHVRCGACIGCTRCDSVCPDNLLPSHFISKCLSDFDGALLESGMDFCSECGACSYVCPANLPIHEIAAGNTEPLYPEHRYKKRALTSAPFIHHAENSATVNFDIVLALLAVLAVSWSVFGIKALMLSALSVLCAVISDTLYGALTRSGGASALNLNSVVCGLMCALTLGINTPLYVAPIVSFFAIMFARGIFGGNSKNILHSAFCARIFASVFWHDAFIFDAPNTSAPLTELLICRQDGPIGEISVAVLAVCAIYLIIRRVISPITPIMTLLSFSAVTFILSPDDPLGGIVNGLCFSAIVFVSVFCEAEPSTVPRTGLGKIVYGTLCGAAAALVGSFFSVEGAYIAAVAASIVTPLFNRARLAEPYPEETDTPEIKEEENNKKSRIKENGKKEKAEKSSKKQSGSKTSNLPPEAEAPVSEAAVSESVQEKPDEATKVITAPKKTKGETSDKKTERSQNISEKASKKKKKK